MNLKISAVLSGALLAALGLLAPQSKPNPIEAARLNNLGAAYMNQQLFEKGLKAFQQAAELDPKLMIARLNEGIAYLNLQRFDEAKAALEDALKQDPKNPHAWYNLGLLAKNTGEAQTAIDAFKHVTEIDANDPDTWYFLGSAYVQAKQFPQAIEAFQRALQLNPLHASAEFGLSRAYQQSAAIDHAREHLKKFQYITQNKLGAPISLAYGEQGPYSRTVESASGVLKAPAQIKVRFVEVTKEAGIVSGPTSPDLGAPWETFGQGACFFDYDGDGRIDLYLADGGKGGGQSLYRNLGGGKFQDVTASAGLDPTLHAVSCTTGDYDNDGATDLAVNAGSRILLFHNEKNGTFKDVTKAAGISSDGSNIGLTFIDYDHDGDIDLFVNHSDLKKSQGQSGYVLLRSDVMWRNNANAPFTNERVFLGLSGDGEAANTRGAIGTDFNNDRAVGLIVTGGRQLSIFEN